MSDRLLQIRTLDLPPGVHRPTTGLPRWKRPFDLVIAGVALIFAAPIILVAALVVRLDGSASFYLQDRLGAGGRRFTLYKLRTMQIDSGSALNEILQRDQHAREEFVRTGKLDNDPRISGIGRLLRRRGIDELPQLLNVIRGEMSIVGPRPRTLRWLSSPEADTLQFRAYFAVRPGITGLWQISDRSKSNDQTRAQLDASYLENVSFWVDLSILARTIPLFILGR